MFHGTLTKRLSICIIAHNAYPAISRSQKGHIGGAERQTSLMAKWMAQKGHQISLLTWDEGQANESRIGGVRIVKSCPAQAGIPVVRFFHPRMSSLFSAMRLANAEIYYHNSAEYVTGLAAAWCRWNHRRFVYSAAAELACDARLPLMHRLHERVLYRYGLRRADRIIVQTLRQQELLQKGFGRRSIVLPMPCHGPEMQVFKEMPSLAPPKVVWVGRLAVGKRLEWLLDIAHRMPGVEFHVAGANMKEDSYSHGLYARFSRSANVVWLGQVPLDRIGEVYRGSLCLCCTSLHEGFPNTFLEAWSYGRPVVSSWDPDGLIVRNEMGLVSKSVDEFTQAISRLLANQDLWRKCSNNGRRYYEKNHLTDVAMGRFVRVFMDLSSKNVAGTQMTVQ